MHRNEEQPKFQCRIISIANANTHCSHWLTLQGLERKKEVKSVSCVKVTMLSISIDPFSKMAAENSNKLILAEIKNVYQH